MKSSSVLIWFWTSSSRCVSRIVLPLLRWSRGNGGGLAGSAEDVLAKIKVCLKYCIRTQRALFRIFVDVDRVTIKRVWDWDLERLEGFERKEQWFSGPETLTLIGLRAKVIYFSLLILFSFFGTLGLSSSYRRRMEACTLVSLNLRLTVKTNHNINLDQCASGPGSVEHSPG